MENSYQLTGRPCGLYPFSGSCLFSPVRLCVCYCSLLSSRSAWALQDLNLGPTDYESAALTAELRARESGNMTDRKSTRLNSSHRCISYAVFCLKKKKKKHIKQTYKKKNIH